MNTLAELHYCEFTGQASSMENVNEQAIQPLAAGNRTKRFKASWRESSPTA